MRNTLLILLLSLFVALFCRAQEPGASCTELHSETRTLCTLSDGSGVDRVYRGSSFTEDVYPDPEKWHAHYVLLLQIDAEYLRRMSAVYAAQAIHDKKSCKAAGFAWSHAKGTFVGGVCNVPEATK